MITIAMVAVILGCCALVAGLIVGLAYKFLHIYSYHKIDAIYAVLPHTDCGVCGYDSCLSFARAVAEGKAVPDGCVMGGKKIEHEVADIIGVVLPLKEDVMAVIHCKGGTGQALLRSQYEGLPDCHAAALIDNGPKICSDGCLGFGTCIRCCPFDAISIAKNGVAIIDDDLCTGCGKCLSSCPRQLITLIPKVHNIFLACANHERGAKVKKYCDVGCTACGICVKTSFSGAIKMKNNLPAIDYTTHENFVAAAFKCPSRCFVDLVAHRPKVNIDTKCDGCTVCVQVCPANAIEGEKGIRHIIDKNNCIGCGICLNVCHVHAISLMGGLAFQRRS